MVRVVSHWIAGSMMEGVCHMVWEVVVGVVDLTSILNRAFPAQEVMGALVEVPYLVAIAVKGVAAVLASISRVALVQTPLGEPK